MSGPAHAHTLLANPARDDHEFREFLLGMGMPDVHDWEMYWSAERAECKDCQKQILASVAAEPERSARLVMAFQVVNRMCSGTERPDETALMAPTPPARALDLLIAEALPPQQKRGVWLEPGALANMLDTIANALTVRTVDERRRCLASWANLAVAADEASRNQVWRTASGDSVTSAVPQLN